MSPLFESKEMIAKPSREPKHLYMRDEGDQLSLQHQMRLGDQRTVFARILADIRQSYVPCGLERNVKYSQQRKQVLERIKEYALERIPLLRRYEEGWPVECFLKQDIKDRSNRHSHKKKTEPQGVSAKRASGDTRQMTVQHEEESHPTRMSRGPARSQKHARRGFILGVSSAMKTGTSRARSSVIELTASPSPMPSSSKPTTTARAAAPAAPSLQPVSSAPARSIADLLTRTGLPLTDVARIATLFADLGIADAHGAYLRVFARMESRDQWLKEMRDSGKLSEIQMRVLREVLGRLAREA